MPLAKIAQKLFGPTQLTPSKNPFFDGKTIAINFFETTQNWGDTINLYLLEKISGKKPVIAPPSQQHILAVGSILRIANHNSIVWGSGFISKKGNIKYKPLKICAVRGPLTRSLIWKKGIEPPEVHGVPALLMHRFYHLNVAKQYSLGVIPHYRDSEKPVIKTHAQQGAHIHDINKTAEDQVDDSL